MIDENAKFRTIGELVIALPVFRETAIHLAVLGELPPVEEVEAWVMAEDSKLSPETANRRAQTVLAWVSNVNDNSPEVVVALADAPASAAAL